jgi:hypothetical protein
MKTWRYDVGRSVVLLTEDGILFAKTTWGNYTYKFETPGVDDFRKFFLGISERTASKWTPKTRYLIEKFQYEDAMVSHSQAVGLVLDTLGPISKQIECDLASEAGHVDS